MPSRYDPRTGPLKGWRGSPRISDTEQWRGVTDVLGPGYRDSMGEYTWHDSPPQESAMSGSRTPSAYAHLIDMSLAKQRAGGGVDWRSAQEAYERGLALKNEWHPVTRGGEWPYWPGSGQETSKLRDPYYHHGEFGPWKP
jgi:hypothetical protein